MATEEGNTNTERSASQTMSKEFYLVPSLKDLNTKRQLPQITSKTSLVQSSKNKDLDSQIEEIIRKNVKKLEVRIDSKFQVLIASHNKKNNENISEIQKLVASKDSIVKKAA